MSIRTIYNIFFPYLGYAHNTYHGPIRHYRPTLSSLANDKPLRFTDSPQHYAPNQAMVLASNVPTPSPRRKSSSTSTEGVEVKPLFEKLRKVKSILPWFIDMLWSAEVCKKVKSYGRIYLFPDFFSKSFLKVKRKTLKWVHIFCCFSSNF